MLGRTRARRRKLTGGSSKESSRPWAVASGVALAFLATVNNCGFPEYAFHNPSSAGAGMANAGRSGAGGPSDAGSAGTPGGGGSGAVGGHDVGEAGDAGSSG